MPDFERISVDVANAMITEGSALIVDVRDEQSYAASHVPNAVHLSNESVSQFVDSADTALPVVVYCYHCNSSQGAEAFLNEIGFEKTFSVDGGFEAWQSNLPAKES